MSTVEEIIKAVEELDAQEKSEFLTRLTEINFDDEWDRQMTADAENGRLDRHWRQAVEEIEAGDTQPLDGIINDR